MIFQKEYMQQFREADPDGKIGLRGYMSYFQDMATHYMHNLGKGNDTLPEEYGICWMYTKYRLHIEKKADFATPILMETWAEQRKKPSISVYQDLRILQNGHVCAVGRLESCLYDMNAGRITKLNAIDYPQDTMEDRRILVEDGQNPMEDGQTSMKGGQRSIECGQLSMETFRKLPKQTEDMNYSYTHTIRYTDLDKSMHMNNLQYINLFLNAFATNDLKQHEVTDFEIHYLNQCYEKEEIDIYTKESDFGVMLAACKKDGTLAAQAVMEFAMTSPLGKTVTDTVDRA